MVGVIGGTFVLFALVASAWGRDLHSLFGSPVTAALLALGVLAIAWFLSFLMPRTLGLASVGYMIGAAVAAVIALFTGQAAYTLPLLLHAVMGIIIGNGCRIRMGGVAY